MDKEFAEYDALVDELEQYIEESRAEFASTERLKLQLNHANEQLGQLRAKFNEFKQPITLYEKMERIQKQMAEVETALDDLGAGVQVSKKSEERCWKQCRPRRPRPAGCRRFNSLWVKG